MTENHHIKNGAKTRHITKDHIIKMLSCQLTVKETEQTQYHLSQCTYCADLFSKVMEQGYLISPPPDMKEHILKKSRRIRQQREYSKKMQLFFYSLRVGAAMCFALLLLFVIDYKTSSMEIKIPDEKKGFQLEMLTNINHNINEVTTKIITMEGKKNDTEKE